VARLCLPAMADRVRRGVRSYGQLLIINAGGGIIFFLPGLSQIDVQLANSWLAGETGGRDECQLRKSRLRPRRRTDAPILYIEFPQGPSGQ